MQRIRRLEELYPAGELPGFIHHSIGQEAWAAGVCLARRRDDYITRTDRGHGHCIAKGAPIDAMMAEPDANVTGFCKGKGGSMHIADFSVGMLCANGVVDGGANLASRSSRAGDALVDVQQGAGGGGPGELAGPLQAAAA